MEEGYLVLTVSASASVEEVTFKCFAADSQLGAERLRGRLRDIKQRLRLVPVDVALGAQKQAEGGAAGTEE